MTPYEYIRGSVKYRVSSDSHSVLINRLRSEIAIRRVTVLCDEEIQFCIFYGDLHLAEKIINELGSITNKKCRGLPFLFEKYRRRVGLFAGALIFLLMAFLSTFFVWEIDVYGNEDVSDAEIIGTLKKSGFGVGNIKKRVDIDSVVNRFLIAEDRVSFIAINFDGGIARVQVIEADIPLLEKRQENVNLVASCDGIIMRADALSGKSEVESGETVTKGQLLVSAFVDKRTGGSILKGAKGYVFAMTQRAYRVYVPLEYNTKRYTSQSLCGVRVEVLGKGLSFRNILGRKTKPFEKVTNKLEKRQNIHLPFSVFYDKVTEYEIYISKRSEAAALDKARQEAERRLYSVSPDFKLASSEESKRISGGCLEYTVVFSGIENIATEKEFLLS